MATTRERWPRLDSAYDEGAGGPPLAVRWRDSNRALRNFASGYTFTLKMRKVGAVGYALTITTGFTGYDPASNTNPETDPNLVLTWPSSTLATLTPGEYRCRLEALATGAAAPLVRQFLLPISGDA